MVFEHVSACPLANTDGITTLSAWKMPWYDDSCEVACQRATDKHMYW